MNKPKTTLSFLWQVIKPYKWWYLLMMQAPFANGVYSLLYNYSIKLLIDLFSKNEQITSKMAFYPVFWFVFASIYIEFCWRIHNYASWKSMPYIMKNVMSNINDYIVNHSYIYFQNNLTGSIVSKIKGINDGAQKIHNALEFHVSNPVIMTVFTGIALAIVNLKLFFIIIIFASIQGSVAVYFGKRLNKIEQDKETAWHGIVGRIADNISNIFTIFAYAKARYENNKVCESYDKVYVPLALKWHKVDFIMSCLTGLYYCVFVWFLMAYLIHLRNIATITVGDIAYVLSLTYIFMDNTWRAINAIKDFTKDIANFKASFSIMETPQEIIDKPNALPLQVSKGEIIFKNLSFSYENNNTIFNNLNLHIKAGQKIGIVGHSGAGKSTLISLLLKNFKATGGDIIIDNQSIYDISSDSLRSQISLIPQDIMLFHRTIGENIGYAKENAVKDLIENAAKIANIHEFIENLPEKYNTIVGERGIKLSGGQRQRIAIARAILKNAPILILDEATSALDSKTEQEIQKSINTMLDVNNATVIAIAHRLSTIKHLDRIIVLEDGKIMEDGSFQDLLAKNDGKFKSMWDHQVNGMVI